MNENVKCQEMPCLRTREEMMKISKERMRDIVAGREQTLSHDEAMKMINSSISCNLFFS